MSQLDQHPTIYLPGQERTESTGKIPVFKVSLGGKTCVHIDWRAALSDVEDLLDKATPGDPSIEVQCSEMTQRQLDELDEFDGW